MDVTGLQLNGLLPLVLGILLLLPFYVLFWLVFGAIFSFKLKRREIIVGSGIISGVFCGFPLILKIYFLLTYCLTRLALCQQYPESDFIGGLIFLIIGVTSAMLSAYISSSLMQKLFKK